MKQTIAVVALLASLTLTSPASAQNTARGVASSPAGGPGAGPVAATTRTRPMAPPLPPALPAPRDVPYAGTISLRIDASDVDRGLYRVEQTFPVSAGRRELTLLQPGWLPGAHSESGTYALLAGIHFYAIGSGGNQEIVWTRDPVAVNAFHLPLPEGTSQVIAKFIHTSPLQTSEGRVTMTPDMLNLQWEKMSLYPAGYYTRGIAVQPVVTVPKGWTVYTALDGMQRQNDTVTWAPTDYERLVDSPIFAGSHARRFELGQGVWLDAVADEPELLNIKSGNLQTYRNLVAEALATFGSRHFDHYDFLLALSNNLGGIGLEHHRSSENRMEATAWTDWDGMDWARNVIPHEFTHSWNGKFRRGADLWTPDFQQPMQNSMLWVYEGQTQFWGYVLAARSGVQSKGVILGSLANAAGKFAAGLPGRDWRSVEDTTMLPQLNMRRPLPWASLTRGEDYYTEGALVWLEVDQVIRKGTGGAKGLDDFARAFFGVHDGDWGELTYTFEDVVSALNGVYPYDWATFLRARIYATSQPAPLNGIELGGYSLVWKDRPNPYDEGIARERKSLDLTYSLGMTLDKDGKVTATLWDSPAYAAGIVNTVKVTAVNGRAYSDAVLKDAIGAAATGGSAANSPITLLLRRGERYETVKLDYHGGLRWPWLESTTPTKVNGLDRLLAPHRK